MKKLLLILFCPLILLAQTEPVQNAFESKQLALAMTQKDRAEALKILQEASKNEEASAALFYNLGNLYREVGNLKESINAYKKSIDIFPEFYKAHKNLGIVYSLDGQFENSLKSIDTAVGIKGADASIYLCLASNHMALKNYESALFALNNALIFDSQNLNLKINKAFCMHELGRAKELEGLCEEILNLDKKNQTAWKYLCSSHVAQGETKKAIATLESMKYMNLATLSEIALLGDLYFNLKFFDKAYENYKVCIDEKNFDLDRKGRIAYAYAINREFEKAKIFAPENVYGFYALALVAEDSKDFTSAKKYYEKILLEKVDDSTALYRLAKAQLELGEKEIAKINFALSAKNPEYFVYAKYELARIALDEKNVKQALDYLKEIKVVNSTNLLDSQIESLEAFLNEK